LTLVQHDKPVIAKPCLWLNRQRRFSTRPEYRAERIWRCSECESGFCQQSTV